MPLSFSPKGFDEERKQRAAECEAKWDAATGVAAFLAVGATTAMPPLAAGLVLVAALCPVMRYPFTRIKNDPRRQDFFVATRARPQELDPTVLFSYEQLQDDYMAPLMVSMSSASDRVAAHLDATVLAVERAMGAYAHRADAAMESRVAEARAHATHATRSAWALMTSARLLASHVGGLPGPDHWDEDRPIASYLSAEQIDVFVATGADESILHWQLQEPQVASPEMGVIAEAAGESFKFLVENLLPDLPPSVHEFIAEGDESGHEIGILA